MKRSLRIAVGLVMLLSMVLCSGFMAGGQKALADGEKDQVYPSKLLQKAVEKKDFSNKVQRSDYISRTAAGDPEIIKSNKTFSSGTHNKNVLVAPGYKLTIGKNAKVVFNGDLVIYGSFVMSSGTITVNGDIIVFGSFSASGTSKIIVNAAKTVINGSYGGSFVASDYLGYGGSLSISGSTSVVINYANKGGFFIQDYAYFSMSSSSAKITVNNNCYFGGGMTIPEDTGSTSLTAGTLEIVNGGFYQSRECSNASFLPSASFKVIIRATNTTPRIVFFESPTESYFTNLSVNGVTFHNESLLSLNLGVMNSDRNLNFTGISVVLAGDLNGKKLTIKASTVYPAYSYDGKLSINNGTLTVNGNLVTYTGDCILMTGSNCKLVVNGNMSVTETLFLECGELDINGNFSQQASFTCGSDFKVKIIGQNRLIDFSEPQGSFFTNFDASAGSLGANSVVSIITDLHASATWPCPNLYYRGNLNGHSLTVSGSLTIPESSVLTVNGGSLRVGANLTVIGSLVMTNYEDIVRVGGNFTKSGGSASGELSSGRLYIGGNFTQAVTDGNFPATGDHTTIFSGQGTQSISFESSSPKFANLAILNKGVIPPDGRYNVLTTSSTNLSGITSGGVGNLSPSFSAGTSEYKLLLPNGTDDVTVTLTPEYPSASLLTYKINNGTEQAATGGIDITDVPYNGKTVLTATVSAINAPYDGVSPHPALDSSSYNITVETINPDLDGLALPEGKYLEPTSFDPATTSYTVQLPETAGSFVWAPPADHPESSVAVKDGTTNLGANTTVALGAGETKTYTVTVTAQDNTTKKDYTVTFTRRNPIESITVSGGTLAPAFNKGTGSYHVYIPATTASVDLTAAVTTDSSDLRVNDAPWNGTDVFTVAPDPGATLTATITAKDADGKSTTTYTVAVHRVAMLSGIGLSAGSLTPAFAPETSAYSVYLPASTSSLTITPAKTSGCSATIDGKAAASKTYSIANGGRVTATIACTGPGGTAQTYTVNVYRIAPITGIAVTGGTLSPAFSVNTRTYTISISAATESVRLAPVVAASYRAGTGDAVAPVTLAPVAGGSAAATFQATAVDGRVFTYTVTVRRAVILTGIKVSTGSLSPKFVAATTNYTLTIPATATQVKITPVKAAKVVKYIKFNGKTASSCTVKMPVIGGRSTMNIVVYGKDGRPKATYCITVIRAALITGIGVSAGTLSPAFDATRSAYSVQVGADVASVNVTPIKAYGSLAVTNSIPTLRPPVGGSATTTIVATVNKKVKSVYTVTARRASIINNISVSGGTLSPSFNAATKAYSINLPATSTSPVTITPAPDTVCSGLTIDGDAIASKTVDPAIGGKITVVIRGRTAAGTSDTYTITVSKAALVASISCGTKGYALTPAFKATTMDYTINLAAGTTSAVVNAAKTSGAKTLTMNGAAVTSCTVSPAISGMSTVTIVATAPDNVTKSTYTVKVYRAVAVTNITASAGTLSPAFSYNTTDYTVELPVQTASVTLTPTVAPGYTCTNDATGTGGAATVSLAPGETKAVRFTATGGTAYTFNVHRAGMLAGIAASQGPDTFALSPDFDANTGTYTVDVPAGVGSVTISPAAAAGCGYTIEGAGSDPSILLNLGVGGSATATVNCSLTGNPTVLQTYTVTVRRAAALSDIGASYSGGSLTLNPTFDAGTLAYTVDASGTSDAMVTITPVASEDVAISMKVEGGEYSAVSTLDVAKPESGSQIVSIRCTPVNGLPAVIYTVTIQWSVPTP